MRTTYPLGGTRHNERERCDEDLGWTGAVSCSGRRKWRSRGRIGVLKLDMRTALSQSQDLWEIRRCHLNSHKQPKRPGLV